MLATEAILDQKGRIPFSVGGRWSAPDDVESLVVDNPATGEVLAELAYGDADLATAAADAAAAALPEWSASPARARSEVLAEAGRLLVARAEAIGRLLSLETGKRLAEAVGEVRFAAEYLRWFAEECRRPHGEVLTAEDRRRRHLVVESPIGVVASLTPWNFPVSIQARKVAPALAAGCTVVARASERAPIAVSELFRALDDAGLPPGVANLVHGPAAALSEALLSHPGVRMVTFTGSTGVGASLMAIAARRVVRCALELGGDAPFAVFADADLDAAADDLMVAKFRNNGQSCIAANRVFVEACVLDAFCEALAARVERLVVGDPLAPATDLGPLIDAGRAREVEAIAEEALGAGASWVGEPPALPAGETWTRPGFLLGAPASCRLATAEVFGPIAGVFAFEHEDELVEQANATEMGLAGYLYTNDARRQWRLAERLEVGILGVNHPLPSVAFAPMGGMKQSGLGREGGRLGFEEFLETRYVSIGL